MKILTVDVGTGTQDIFLYNPQLDIENGFKLVLPSPTMQVFRRIKEATKKRTPIVLTGVMMGGGPSAWASEEHAKAGLPVYATSQAARTINDDLDQVESLGITLISDDEVLKLPDTFERIEFRDFDLEGIRQVFNSFGVTLNDLAAVGVAVFDHGNAPSDVSDRQFRFDYLDARIQKRNDLRTFAFLSDEIPESMTRFDAVVKSCKTLDSPLVVMDTAPAAVLGASFDEKVQTRSRKIIANVGNFHTLAFRLDGNRIEGLFEHHTGLLKPENLETLLLSLAQGDLHHETVFNNHGHGALIYDPKPFPMETEGFNLVVTGPRRNLIKYKANTSSNLRPYFAVPFGDMMIAGCFGLLAATADQIPELREPIMNSLSEKEMRNPTPWDN